MNPSIISEFISHSASRMEENTAKIVKCMEMLREEEIWKKPNDASNSMGNILLHLCGNIRQYILSSLGGEPDVRERDLEFATTGGYNRTELLAMLKRTIGAAIEVIKKLDEASLLRERSVQGFNYSGLGIVLHVVEHYSYHTGQIAFWTKLLHDRDLRFYAGMDLNRRNKP